MRKTQLINRSQIAERAFAIWEKEGQPHGRDLEHWRQAEEELLDTSDTKKPAPAKRTAKTAAKPAAKAAKAPAKPTKSARAKAKSV